MLDFTEKLKSREYIKCFMMHFLDLYYFYSYKIFLDNDEKKFGYLFSTLSFPLTQMSAQ